eukprot:CAMPEP_0178379418 /NCGR_PEP_ID=MMETSP0689_2-20121128/4932_1 /TAXON_ID=160604 /ORGANISM="Amphidinium massartii, Strain CS-259" /LENGTH=112 /DNA_ID=CAMNT_0019999519 /DNA_START=1076 /DNA_END=1415 /DNA_ORIENTATION=-
MCQPKRMTVARKYNDSLTNKVMGSSGQQKAWLSTILAPVAKELLDKVRRSSTIRRNELDCAGNVADFRMELAQSGLCNLARMRRSSASIWVLKTSNSGSRASASACWRSWYA